MHPPSKSKHLTTGLLLFLDNGAYENYLLDDCCLRWKKIKTNNHKNLNLRSIRIAIIMFNKLFINSLVYIAIIVINKLFFIRNKYLFIYVLLEINKYLFIFY